MRRLLLVPLAALALAGCGGGDSEEDVDAAQPPVAPAQSSAPVAPPAGSEVRIGMKDLQFMPRTQQVRLGQTVKWVDDEDIAHNVVADEGASFKSTTFGKGQSYTFKPTEVGQIKYVCTIHPGMEGTLDVIAK